MKRNQKGFFVLDTLAVIAAIAWLTAVIVDHEKVTKQASAESVQVADTK